MTLLMTASEEFASSLAGCLEAEGWSRDAALRELRASSHRLQSAVPEGRVGVDAVEAMFRAAEAALDDPAIGLRAGHRFRVGTHGRTGSIYSHAKDLPDVIDLNARYQRLALDLGVVSEVWQDERPLMAFRPHFGGDAQQAAHYRHCSTMLMAAYVTAYRWLNWGSGEDLVSVGIPAPACERVRACAETLFRCPTQFGLPTGHLEFTPRAMRTPLSTADPEKRARAVAMLDGLLDGADQSQSFRRAVRESIRAALASGPVTLSIVAARLDMGESELRRRLRDAGLQFRSETDAVRQALLRERYDVGDTLASIAQALGYNDQAALNRAVKRWYGVAPSQWNPAMPLLVDSGKDDRA